MFDVQRVQRPLIIATGNRHKVEEFEKLLKGSLWTALSADVCGGMPEVAETGATFAENAFLKASALRKQAPEDTWILADDSGLEVDVLRGEPGVYSARYAGPEASDQDNIAKLLKALENVPALERTARFKCVLCLIDPEGSAVYYEGTCEGRIATAVFGESGFGYDPVFIPKDYSQSFAALGSEIKQRLSHRARAVESMHHGN